MTGNGYGFTGVERPAFRLPRGGKVSVSCRPLPILMVYGKCIFAALVRACCWALLLLVSCDPSRTTVSVPTVGSPADELPAGWNDEPVVILADSTTHVWHRPANLETRRITWYYVARNMPPLLNTVSILEHEALEHRPRMLVDVWYPDGTTWSSRPSSVRRVEYVREHEFSSSRKLQTVTLPRYVQGMRIRLEVRRSFYRPWFVGGDPFRRPYPVRQRSSIFAMPADARIGWECVNPESLDISLRTSRQGDTTRVAASCGNLDALNLDIKTAFPEQTWSAMYCSYPLRGDTSPTWREMGDYYLSLLAEPYGASAGIEKLDSRIDTGGGHDSIALEAFRVVTSRIRYHADMEKSYGILPRPISRTLSNGYGDCKEMSMVLWNLLQRRGVESGLALVATPGTPQLIDSIPSLSGSNHIIVWFVDENNTIRFLDPTVYHDHPFMSVSGLVGQKVHVLKQGHSTIDTIKPRPEYRSIVVTRARIGRNDDHEWIQRGSVILKGHIAHTLYPRMYPLSPQESVPPARHLMTELFNLSCSSVSIDSLSPVCVTFSYTADVRKNVMEIDRGGFRVDAPSLLGDPGRYTTRNLRGPRRFLPFVQTDTWQFSGEFGEFQRQCIDDEIGRGCWELEGSTLTRNYTQSFRISGREDEVEARNFIAQRRAFGKTAIWR